MIEKNHLCEVKSNSPQKVDFPIMGNAERAISFVEHMQENTQEGDCNQQGRYITESRCFCHILDIKRWPWRSSTHNEDVKFCSFNFYTVLLFLTYILFEYNFASPTEPYAEVPDHQKPIFSVVCLYLARTSTLVIQPTQTSKIKFSY